MSTRNKIKDTLTGATDRLVPIQPASSCWLRVAWPVSTIHIACGYLHERKSHKRHFAFPNYDFCLSDNIRVIQSGSLARNTHICPFRRIAKPSSPKAQSPLYYSKQIQRAVEGMCMASGKSLQTTCERANMRFYHWNFDFCVNFNCSYNLTPNLKQAISSNSFCCMPNSSYRPGLKHYYLHEIHKVIWNAFAKFAR